MCVSMNVSFAVAGVVGAVGIASLRKVREKKEYAIALVPILFAVQQIVEGLIWYFIDSGTMYPCLTNTYGFFAYIFWPLYIPIAVGLIEPNRVRQRFIALCGFLGAIASVDMLYAIWTHGISVAIVQRSLVYTIPTEPVLIIQTFYVVGVCVSAMASSYVWIRRLGFSVAVALVLSFFWFSYALHSIWCFAAALLSTLVYMHFASRRAFIHRR